jgi:long-chain acyl-CoA synthetase
MRVEEFLTDSARRLPGKMAVVAGKRRLTFAELDVMSDRLAAALIKRGIGRSDRVVVFMDNSFEAVVAVFAILKAGAVFSPVNPSTKSDKLGFILENCRAAGVITQARLAGVTGAAVARSAWVKLVVLAGGGTAPAAAGCLSFEDAIATTTSGDAPAVPGIALDLAMIIYTSGSTGFPKGVMLTHENIVAAATSITTYLGSREEDVILGVLPLSFDYGLYQVLMAMKVGATLVVEKSFTFPQMILNRVAEEKVTGLPLVPTMAAILLQLKDLRPDRFPHLRYITNTAAALPPTHIARLQELFPSAQLFSMYGLTECKRCTYLPPAELARRPGSVGIAIPGTDAYVVDESGARVGPGVAGELVIRGPHVMKGYWENQPATDAVLRPGPFPWEKVLHTGDVFRSDEEGFLYFVGRKDDIIKSRGEKVAPKEVENVLYALPGVREAAVIGVPDAILGMAIRAVIALAPEARVTEQDVIRHCAKHLEDFMVPREIEFRDDLPKTDTGKISRRLIEAEMLEVAP